MKEKNNESLYEVLKKIMLNNESKINEILNKKNLLIIVGFYIIGILIIFIRNSIVGLPFMEFSIIDYSILSTYYIILASIFLIFEHIINKIITTVNEKNKLKEILKKIFYIIICSVIVFSLSLVSRYIYFDVSLKNVLIFAQLIYIVIPLIRNMINDKDAKRLSIFFPVIVFALLVNEIPITYGGLKPISVLYTNYQLNESKEYEFYGTKNGLHILRRDNMIYFKSIDSGDIQYKYNKQ